MPNRMRPDAGAPPHKRRNKDRSDPTLSHAWKEINDQLQREDRRRRPAPTTRPLTRSGRPRADTQTRKARAAKAQETKARRKAERAQDSEHDRRSRAAKKGWDKIPAAERSERARRGWETRDQRYGRTREKRQDQRYADEARRLRRHGEYGHGSQPIAFGWDRFRQG